MMKVAHLSYMLMFTKTKVLLSSRKTSKGNFGGFRINMIQNIIRIDSLCDSSQGVSTLEALNGFG